MVSLFADLRQFSDMTRTGRFDRLMLRPRGLLFQLILNNADVIASIGHGTVSGNLHVHGTSCECDIVLHCVCFLENQCETVSEYGKLDQGEIVLLLFTPFQ